MSATSREVWYFHDTREQYGPLNSEELIALAEAQEAELKGDGKPVLLYVWKSPWEKWREFLSFEAFENFIEAQSVIIPVERQKSQKEKKKNEAPPPAGLAQVEGEEVSEKSSSEPFLSKKISSKRVLMLVTIGGILIALAYLLPQYFL